MKKYILLLAITLVSVHTWAQENRTKTLINAALHGWEYESKAGFNIGGTLPLPFPEEIRNIKSYNPTLSITIEGNMTKWLGEQKRWGVVTGLRLENKGMRTKAEVKNYGMEIIGEDGNRLKGNWTGGVRTKVQNSYLTIPILAAYKLNQRVNLKAGAYFSYLMDGDFSGHVYEGYLRKDDPTGEKVNFNNGAIASYDFSSDLRNFQWGAQLGVDWKAFKHLKVYADLNWGMNDIFNKDFKTITFDMYAVYLNVGFGYAF